jgi:hypothetical protein
MGDTPPFGQVGVISKERQHRFGVADGELPGRLDL